MTCEEIIAALRRQHPDLHGEWVSYVEFQRIDFFAMHAWPSRKHERHGYEIKVSRADFRAEIRKPGKRLHALSYCHRFSFAVPAGMVIPQEVPVECGLVWVHPGGEREWVAKPPRRDDVRAWSDADMVYISRFQLWKEGIDEMAHEISRLRFDSRMRERAGKLRDANPSVIGGRVRQATLFDELAS